MGSSSWYHPYSWASRMSQTFLCKVFFFHLFYNCLLSLVYEVGCRAANKYIFSFLCKNIHVYYHVPFISNNTECYQTFLISSFFSATESPFQGFQGIIVKPQSKFCCTFVNISLILTNDWQLLQICKHLLTYSPCQWWVHQSLVSPYCLTYPC